MKRRVLRWLRLSERPDSPPGSGSELLVFRSSKRQLWVDAARWLMKQLGALVGLLVSLAFLGTFDLPIGFAGIDFVRDVFRDGVEVGFLHVEGDPWVLVKLFELGAIGVYGVQFLFGAFFVKLAWEVRWYLVSEESLRIREGLVRVHERTMTVANVQNLSVRRGPLQRLLGIADLEVRTAGGGAKESGDSAGEGSDDLHLARFRGVEDPDGLRDRIRAAVERHRGPGLGEGTHEDRPTFSREEPTGLRDDRILEAAGSLLTEARALRITAQRTVAAVPGGTREEGDDR